jgi:hypothetical protein
MSDSNNNFVTWVPSKRALETGFPVGVDPTKDYNLAKDRIPSDALYIMVTRAYRHMLNNEAASATLAAKEAAEKKNEPFDLVNSLHEWRVDKINEIYENRLGMRQPAADQTPTDPVMEEAEKRAFDVIATHVKKQGGTFPYTVLNARSRAWVHTGRNQTMQELIEQLLTTKRGVAIVEKARATIAEREAQVASLTQGEEAPWDDAA